MPVNVQGDPLVAHVGSLPVAVASTPGTNLEGDLNKPSQMERESHLNSPTLQNELSNTRPKSPEGATAIASTSLKAQGKPTTGGAVGTGADAWAKSSFALMALSFSILVLLVSRHIESPLSGISYSIFGHPRTQFSPDFTRLLDIQRKFEKLLDYSAGSSISAVDITNVEIAVQDLGELMERSSATSKDSLVVLLNEFSTSADVTSRHLQTFANKAGEAVNRIVSANEHMVKLLENMPDGAQPISAESVAKPEPSMGQLGVTLAVARRKELEVEVEWFQVTGVMESTVRQLAQDAKANIVTLGELKSQYNYLNNPDNVENKSAQAQSQERLSMLWRLLGESINQLPKYDQNDKLLKDFHTYHESALSHVSGALDQLKVISNDLDELKKHTRRPRIVANNPYASPEALGEMREITELLAQGLLRAHESEDEHRRKMYSRHDGWVITAGP